MACRANRPQVDVAWLSSYLPFLGLSVGHRVIDRLSVWGAVAGSRDERRQSACRTSAPQRCLVAFQPVGGQHPGKNVASAGGVDGLNGGGAYDESFVLAEIACAARAAGDNQMR